jgi:integrase
MVVPGKGKRQFTRLTFHSLRHSFSSALANAGVAEEVRMKLAGHTTRAIHSRYTHLQMGTLRKAVAVLPLFQPPREESGK